MAIDRYGYANENGNQLAADDFHEPKRRSAKYSTCQTMPHHGFVFKAFTRESLKSKATRKKSTYDKKLSTGTQVDGAKSSSPPLPDPYLASGQQLPPALLRQFPSELFGKPIEDIDPYYADKQVSRANELKTSQILIIIALMRTTHRNLTRRPLVIIRHL